MARKTKIETRKKRHRSLRKRINGTAERPRLVVFRSSRHIYVQVIDDLSRKTVVSVSDLMPRKPEKKAAAGDVPTEGKKAERAKKVVFDRAGYKYHGRVSAVAAGAREAGLEF